MIHAKLILATGLLVSAAFAAPPQTGSTTTRSKSSVRRGDGQKREKRKERKKRTKRKRRAKKSGKPSFTGRRTLKPAKLSPQALKRLTARPESPSPFSKPEQIEGGVPAPTLPDKPAAMGPMAGPAPTPPNTEPSEFVFVPPERLGNKSNPVWLLRGQGSWTSERFLTRNTQSITLAVKAPPEGKVAFVRCGVKTLGGWNKAVFAIQHNSMTKTQPIKTGGDLLEFQVFPGSTAGVRIAPDPEKSKYNSRSKWSLTGCDYTVK